jgi:hypothetical protein
MTREFAVVAKQSTAAAYTYHLLANTSSLLAGRLIFAIVVSNKTQVLVLEVPGNFPRVFAPTVRTPSACSCSELCHSLCASMFLR